MRYILCISIRYESCVQWDVYHLDAQQRLAELKECNRVREQLNTTCSTWFQQHPEEESAIKLVKKITLTHLASLHPMPPLPTSASNSVLLAGCRNVAIGSEANMYSKCTSLPFCSSLVSFLVEYDRLPFSWNSETCW